MRYNVSKFNQGMIKDMEAIINIEEYCAQNNSISDDTTAKIAAEVAERKHAIELASYDDLVKALHLLKHSQPLTSLYDKPAGKIGASLAKHVMNNEFDS